MVEKKPYQFLAWLSAILLMSAAFLATLNLMPYYQIMFIMSYLCWTITGILWREPSQVAMNVFLIFIYISGLLYNYGFFEW